MSLQSNIGAARFGRIRDATQRSGLSRGYLYRLAPRHPGLFKKAGAATIVDLQMLDQIMAGLPDANLKPAPERDQAA